MRRPRKPLLPKRRNPLAKLIRKSAFRTRQETSGRAYQRKPKHPKRPDPEG